MKTAKILLTMLLSISTAHAECLWSRMDFKTPGEASACFRASDGWSNGAPFAVGWRADHALVTGNRLVLKAGACPVAGGCSGKAYAGGEYASRERSGYGMYSVKLKAAKGSGLVSGFFTYAANPHDEIDIEILGKDTTRVQLNYFVAGTGGHEKLVDLGFDASAAEHVYAFDWQANRIVWYVDGKEVHRVSASPLPSAAGQVMANLWAAEGVDAWAGVYSGATAQTSVAWIAKTTSPAEFHTDRVLDWAESAYPVILQEGTGSTTGYGYRYRCYLNALCVGVQSETENVFYYDGQNLHPLGPTSNYLP